MAVHLIPVVGLYPIAEVHPLGNFKLPIAKAESEIGPNIPSGDRFLLI